MNIRLAMGYRPTYYLRSLALGVGLALVCSASALAKKWSMQRPSMQGPNVPSRMPVTWEHLAGGVAVASPGTGVEVIDGDRGMIVEWHSKLEGVEVVPAHVDITQSTRQRPGLVVTVSDHRRTRTAVYSQMTPDYQVEPGVASSFRRLPQQPNAKDLPIGITFAPRRSAETIVAMAAREVLSRTMLPSSLDPGGIVFARLDGKVRSHLLVASSGNGFAAVTVGEVHDALKVIFPPMKSQFPPSADRPAIPDYEAFALQLFLEITTSPPGVKNRYHIAFDQISRRVADGAISLKPLD